MKDYSYYTTSDIEFPSKTKYTKSFFYKKGKMIATKVWGEGYDDLELGLPEGTVEEQILDEESYNAHLDLYRSRALERENEYKRDVLEKHGLTHHPQADKIFSIAWGLGGSDLLDVDMCLLELSELFECYSFTPDMPEITFKQFRTFKEFREDCSL
jgi:hypothetical protein